MSVKENKARLRTRDGCLYFLGETELGNVCLRLALKKTGKPEKT